MKKILLILVLLSSLMLAFAQDADNPVQIRLEIYVVSQVTASDGSVEEKFSEATTARPGQIVEYRLFASNMGDTTLPAGTVVITGPVPEGTTFVARSATPGSERLLVEYSADNTTFSEPPVMITETVDGQESRQVADPTDYAAVRWTLLVPIEPGQEETFVYRVQVN